MKIHSYSPIYALGHRVVEDILKTPVSVEEKIDGSQFSFGIYMNEETGERMLRCRSKSADINMLAPERMFKRAIEVVQELEPLLTEGYTYRCEYLAKPKHNSLVYDRVPNKNLMVYDIDIADQAYLSYEGKKKESAKLGLEVVPLLCQDSLIVDLEVFRELLKTPSILGGPMIEGVVVKNYSLYGPDKKVLMAKFVSEAFKEIHTKEWKLGHPSKADVVQIAVDSYRTPARWAKAVQHLREAGQLEDSPRDIEKIMKEIPLDIAKECADEIKEKLWEWAWPKIARGCKAGAAEWYKEELLKKQFEGGNP